MSTTPPRRRLVIRIELGADTWDDAAAALEAIAADLVASTDATQAGVHSSGGYRSSYMMLIDEDRAVTQGSYLRALRAYIANKKATT